MGTSGTRSSTAALSAIAVSSVSPALTDDAEWPGDEMGNDDCGQGKGGDAVSAQKGDGNGHLQSADCEVRGDPSAAETSHRPGAFPGSNGAEAEERLTDLERDQREADQWLQSQDVQEQVQPEVAQGESDISVGNENLTHIDQQSIPPAGTEEPPLHEDLWTHAFWQKVAPKDKRTASNRTSAGRLARCARYIATRDEQGQLNEKGRSLLAKEAERASKAADLKSARGRGSSRGRGRGRGKVTERDQFSLVKKTSRCC